MIRKTIHNISKSTKNNDTGITGTGNKALHIAIVIRNEVAVCVKKFKIGG